MKQGAVDVKDARIAARREIPDESLLVDQESRGVANGFVYLRNVPKNPSGEPWTLPTEVVTVRIDGCRYFPHAAIFTTNQVVQVINEDPLSHGLHYFPVRNPTGLLPIPPAEPMTPLQFKIGEKIPFEIRCDFYPWQKCFWLVLEHPFAALSNAEGEFCITGLPPGTHSITIWHETSGYIERNLKVEVVAGGTTDIGSILMIRR